ncbi:hypothetical protein AB1286_24420 [Trinickia sp. NRRL B-1857]|uniref:hypothetical protein n=1 Tax=Trinickia sp. NRRL B-1857 TaxID=3162879 RepID=UPI003D29BCA3
MKRRPVKSEHRTMDEDIAGAVPREAIELDPPNLPQAAEQRGQWIIHVDDFSSGDKIVVQVPSGQTYWHPTPGDTLRGYLNDMPSENVVYIDNVNVGHLSWETKFDPNTTPDGTYQATYMKTSEVGDVVYSRKRAVVIAGSCATSYQLTLDSLTPNGEPADGRTKNAARAVVTQNGKPLAQPVTVKFVFQNGSAVFDTSGADVQAGSDDCTLYVLTHKATDGSDIADAQFSDTVAETVTLEALLYRQPNEPTRTCDFVFASASTQRYKVKITNHPSTLSDGESARVSGTVEDTIDRTAVNGSCRVLCMWPIGGPDNAPITNGAFSVDVYGEYASSKTPKRGTVTVRYGDGHDDVGIYVFPVPPN